MFSIFAHFGSKTEPQPEPSSFTDLVVRDPSIPAPPVAEATNNTAITILGPTAVAKTSSTALHPFYTLSGLGERMSAVSNGIKAAGAKLLIKVVTHTNDGAKAEAKKEISEKLGDPTLVACIESFIPVVMKNLPECLHNNERLHQYVEYVLFTTLDRIIQQLLRSRTPSSNAKVSLAEIVTYLFSRISNEYSKQKGFIQYAEDPNNLMPLDEQINKIFDPILDEMFPKKGRELGLVINLAVKKYDIGHKVISYLKGKLREWYQDLMDKQKDLVAYERCDPFFRSSSGLIAKNIVESLCASCKTETPVATAESDVKRKNEERHSSSSSSSSPLLPRASSAPLLAAFVPAEQERKYAASEPDAKEREEACGSDSPILSFDPWNPIVQEKASGTPLHDTLTKLAIDYVIKNYLKANTRELDRNTPSNASDPFIIFWTSPNVKTMISKAIQSIAVSDDPTTTELRTAATDRIALLLMKLLKTVAGEDPHPVLGVIKALSPLLGTFYTKHGYELKNYLLQHKERPELAAKSESLINALFIDLSKSIVEKTKFMEAYKDYPTILGFVLGEGKQQKDGSWTFQDENNELPGWLWLACTKLMDLQPQLPEWLFPSDLIPLKHDLEQTPSGRAAVALATPIINLTLKKTQESLKDRVNIVVPLVSTIISSQLKTCLPHGEAHMSQEEYQKWVVDLVMRGIEYYFNDPAAAPLRKLIDCNLHKLCYLFLKDNSTAEGFSLSTLATECIDSVIAFEDRRRAPIEKPEDLFPLVDKFIEQFNLFKIKELMLFNLHEQVRIQLAKQIFAVYDSLEKTKATAPETEVQLVETVDPQLLTLKTTLARLQGNDAGTARERSCIQDEIDERTRALKDQNDPSYVAAKQVKNALGGIVAPIITSFTQTFLPSFLQTYDSSKQISTLLDSQLPPETQQWLNQEVRTLSVKIGADYEKVWTLTESVVAVLLPKFLVNILTSTDRYTHQLLPPIVTTPVVDVDDPNANLNLDPIAVLDSHEPLEASRSTIMADLISRIAMFAINHFVNPSEATEGEKKKIEEILKLRETVVQKEAELQALKLAGKLNEKPEHTKDLNDEKLSSEQNLETSLEQLRVLQTQAALTELLGEDPCAPEHPFSAIPIPDSMKKNLWTTWAPQLIADLMNDFYKKMHPTDPAKDLEALNILYADKDKNGLTHIPESPAKVCQMTGKLSSDIPSHLIRQKDTLASVVFDQLRSYAEAAPKYNQAAGHFQAFLSDRQKDVTDFISSIIETVGRQGARYKDYTRDPKQPMVVDERSDEIKIFWDVVGNKVSDQMKRVLLSLSRNLKSIDETGRTQNITPMAQLLTSKLLPLFIEHNRAVFASVGKAGRSQPHQVSDEVMLRHYKETVEEADDATFSIKITQANIDEHDKQAYAVIIKDAVLRDPAVAACTVDPTTNVLSVQLKPIPQRDHVETVIERLKQIDDSKAYGLKFEREHSGFALRLHPALLPEPNFPGGEKAWRMEKLYKPLAQELLSIIEIQEEDLPHGKVTKGWLEKLMPLVVATMWEQIRDSDNINKMLISSNSNLYIICKAIAAKASELDDPANPAQGAVPDASGVISEAAKADPAWEDFLGEMNRALPFMVKAIMNLPATTDGGRLYGLPAYTLQKSTESASTDWPFLKILEKSLDSTAKSLTHHIFMLPLDIHNNATLEKKEQDKARLHNSIEAVNSTRDMVMTAAGGYFASLQKSFFDSIYRPLCRVADVLCCGLASPIKDFIKAFLELIFSAVRILLLPIYTLGKMALSFYAPRVMRDTILPNLQTKINENFQIHAAFFILETLKEGLKFTKEQQYFHEQLQAQRTPRANSQAQAALAEQEQDLKEGAEF